MSAYFDPLREEVAFDEEKLEKVFQMYEYADSCMNRIVHRHKDLECFVVEHMRTASERHLPRRIFKIEHMNGDRCISVGELLDHLGAALVPGCDLYGMSLLEYWEYSRNQPHLRYISLTAIMCEHVYASS